MSVATLKRKTLQSYKIMSSGFRNFSLNGTRRSQGYVGQTSLSRSLPKTLMKGNVACGYGGCCGKYNITPIVQSAVTSLNNPSVIKASVVNTSGMIETKYRWIKRSEPYTTVKPYSYINLNTEGDYINHLKKKTLAKLNICSFNTGTNISKPSAINFCCTSIYNKIFRSNLHPTCVKTLYQKVTLDRSYLKKSYDNDYLVTLNKSCPSNYDILYVPNKRYNYPVVSST